MADRNQRRVYWDSNCFTAHLWKESGRWEACDAVLQAAKQGQVVLYTSFLTLSEVVKVPDARDNDAAENTISQFFLQPYIVLVQLDWIVAQKSRELQRQFSLKPRDAIHLATALHPYLEIDTMHTYDDDDLVRLNGRLPGSPLRIEHPTWDIQLPLLGSQ